MNELYGNEIAEQNDILHIGTPHEGAVPHSGRYEWGSGKNPGQHGSGDFLMRVNDLTKQYSALSDKDRGGKSVDVCVAEALGMSTGELRIKKRLATNEVKMSRLDQIHRLQKRGYNTTEIAKMIYGDPSKESSIRMALKAEAKNNASRGKNTAEFLKKVIDEKGPVQVGTGTEHELTAALGMGISQGTLKEAMARLEEQGYHSYGLGIKQVTNDKQQSPVKVICPPGMTYHEAFLAVDANNVHPIIEYHSDDKGETFDAPKFPPTSVDSKRVDVLYGDEKGKDGFTGKDRDGLIEVRPGVKDLSMGNCRYAQVRICVDGTHYIKGMATYSDNLPDGVDIRFHTNKPKGTPMCGPKDNTVFKPLKDDPENPFGATIPRGGQDLYPDKNGKYKDPKTGEPLSLGAINRVHDEGDWGGYRRSLPSQFLAKQPIELINKQLDVSYADKKAELESIDAITNPAIRKHYYEEFARKCDKNAVELNAAALPRTNYQVFLPMPTLKDNEIYAPNYKDGEKVAVVRFPHGSIAEIPILTVNNKNKEGIAMVGKNPLDVIGLPPKAEKQLSGADNDGDDALVIPTGRKVKINAIDPAKHSVYKKLLDFEPSEEYPKYQGMKVLTEKEKQKQMGVVSNLIMDMTLKGASDEEMVRAIKHSMVIIDAVKHEYDYKQSERDNGINALKKKYQTHVGPDGKTHEGGASTLITMAGSDYRIPERKGQGWVNLKRNEGKFKVDKKTGEKIPMYDPSRPEGAMLYKESGRTYAEKKKDKTTGEKVKTGKILPALDKVQLLSQFDDAYVLSSGTPQEQAYARYSNNLKALANQARIKSANTEHFTIDREMKAKYAAEVESLNRKIVAAQLNAPRERQANIIAGSRAKAKYDANPQMDKSDYKKLKDREIVKARKEVGIKSRKTKDREFSITDKEWEAIQNHAITEATLLKIINYSDPDELRKRATPRYNTVLSPSDMTKLRAMKASGLYSNADIAEALGVSPSTISRALSEDKKG